MQRLEVSGAVRPLYGSLRVKGLIYLMLYLVRAVQKKKSVHKINPLTPNDPYRGRTAPLTSKRFTLYIYSTNIGIEYFKHGISSPFFFIFKMQFVS
jgi:hypothetical protein